MDEPPRLYALYRNPEYVEEDDRGGSGVVGWVVALPGGSAVVLRADGRRVRSVAVRESLRRVAERWAPLADAELVMVAEKSGSGPG